MAEIEIRLTRPNGSIPWGFRLHGGSDFRSPLVVQRVTAGSVAYNTGLSANDQILSINGVPAQPMKHADAQQTIINSGNNIILRITRGGSPIPTRASEVQQATKQVENLTLTTAKPSPASHVTQGMQSARYEEQTGDYPQYQGYTDPGTQSNSFKTLQGVIASGQDPGSYFQKAPWQSQTANQVSNEPRKYTPSATWNQVHGIDAGRNAPAGPGPRVPLTQAPRATGYRPPPANAPAPVPASQAPPVQSYNSGSQLGQQPLPNNSYVESNYRKPALGPAFGLSGAKPWQPPSQPNRYNPAPQNQPGYHNFQSPSKQAPAGGTSQIPHGEGVATKGTSATQQGKPDETPVCAHCSQDIRGPFVLALNKTWCPNHFTCSKCNSELVNMGFVELQGKIYCENDYEAFFAAKCAKCRQAIVGDTVNALEKTWHPTCFVCFECGAAISSGAFHVESGNPYCMKDWQRLFQTKCISCGYPVEPGDKWIEALNDNWHSDCFTCSVCKTPLEGKPFYPKNGKPFCKDHAQAQ